MVLRKCAQGDLTKQGRDVQALTKRRACECQGVATQREQHVQRPLGSWEELRKGAAGVGVGVGGRAGRGPAPAGLWKP